ncbi:MAG: MFS transporter [Candidatus Limnocylindrales bacterium]
MAGPPGRLPTDTPIGTQTATPTGATWQRLAVVFAITGFVETVGFGHYVTFLPILVRHLGVVETDVATTVGFLSAASFVFGLPLVPFWGVWADKYSRKAIVVRSAAVEAVLFTTLALVGQVWQLYLLVPLVGLVLGNTGVMLAEMTDRAPRDRLGLAISLVVMSGPLGFAVGPAVGGFLVDRYGVQALFLIDTLLTIGTVALLLLAYHERPDRPRASDPVLRLVGRSLRAIVGSRLAGSIFLAYLCLLLGQRFLVPYLALYVEELQGPAAVATVVGLIAGAYGLAAATSSPLAGGLGDRFGYRRVFVVGVGLAVACLSAAAVAPGIVVFGLLYAGFGIGFAAASGMLFTMLASGLPLDIRSSVLNLSLAPLYIAGVIGSLASAGLIAATGGELRPLWLVAAGVVALALLPIARLRPGRA